MIKEYSIKPSLTDTTQDYKKSDKNLNSFMAVDDTGAYSQRKLTRKDIVSSFDQNDKAKLRELSNKLYSNNTIYTRMVDYLRTILCFYWMVTPRIKTGKITGKKDSLINKFWEALKYVEDINPENVGPYIANKVLLDGACYIAVKVPSNKNDAVGLQFLPLEYCRVTKRYKDRDVVDFNVKYFEDKFRDNAARLQALKIYPECITSAYKHWKSGKNKARGSEWQTINPQECFRFSLRKDCLPYFIGIALDLLDLQDTKDITMFKLEQELSKIITQKFNINKDGIPEVDMDTLRQFHTDTSRMLQTIPGVDVITTYADVDSIDLSDGSQRNSSIESVKSVIENVYNSAGVSKLLFNAENAGTLNKSIIIDENIMYLFLNQFEEFLNCLLDLKFTSKNMQFRLTMLKVTYFNRNEMIKTYKEQATLGFSKFLPAIATGQRQSDILSLLYFENEVLDLVSIMKAPISSNNISAKSAGRPQKNEDEVSEKTIKNKESA